MMLKVTVTGDDNVSVFISVTEEQQVLLALLAERLWDARVNSWDPSMYIERVES